MSYIRLTFLEHLIEVDRSMKAKTNLPVLSDLLLIDMTKLCPGTHVAHFNPKSVRQETVKKHCLTFDSWELSVATYNCRPAFTGIEIQT